MALVVSKAWRRNVITASKKDAGPADEAIAWFLTRTTSGGTETVHHVRRNLAVLEVVVKVLATTALDAETEMGTGIVRRGRMAPIKTDMEVQIEIGVPLTDMNTDRKETGVAMAIPEGVRGIADELSGSKAFVPSLPASRRLALESPCYYYYYNWSYENTYRLMLLEHIS